MQYHHSGCDGQTSWGTCRRRGLRCISVHIVFISHQFNDRHERQPPRGLSNHPAPRGFKTKETVLRLSTVQPRTSTKIPPHLNPSSDSKAGKGKGLGGQITCRIRFGSVELEKLRLARTRFGMACRVDVSVIVLPEPGGPQRIRGLWEASHALSTSTCLWGAENGRGRTDVAISTTDTFDFYIDRIPTHSHRKIKLSVRSSPR